MWVDLQTAREQPDPASAFRTVLEKLDEAIARDAPELVRPSAAERATWLENPATGVRNLLRALAERSSKPLVLLFDEADGLVGAAMVSFLSQLRDGYVGRSKLPFPRSIRVPPGRFLRPDGGLDMAALVREWQVFWRKDGHLAAEGFHYRESGPHLMLMAFLQRVINGGGRIEREYGLGRGALDLLIEWQGERHAIEMKLRRDTETEADGLEQTACYLDHLGLTEGWLLLFDLRSTAPWAERLWHKDVEHAGKHIHVVGC